MRCHEGIIFAGTYAGNRAVSYVRRCGSAIDCGGRPGREYNQDRRYIIFPTGNAAVTKIFRFVLTCLLVYRLRPHLAAVPTDGHPNVPAMERRGRRDSWLQLSAQYGGQFDRILAARGLREEVIDRELELAAATGFNSVRVFLQYLVWEHDPEGLLQRMHRFMDMAASHGIRTMWVLFDDCAFGYPPATDPYPGRKATRSRASIPPSGPRVLGIRGSIRRQRS